MRQALIALSLALTLSTPVSAQLVIEGRAAQALHCSAMLFMVSSVMFDAGHISRNARDNAQQAALIMLEKVPGTEAQRIQAMRQRFDRIMSSRTPAQLFDEYSRTARWCRTRLLR
jgi:hypothetical protein